ELALKRERRPDEYRQALGVVHRSADQLSRTVDALVAAASYESGGVHGTADAHAVAADSASACARLAADRGIVLRARAPREQLRVGVDAALAERILQPVVETACRYGASRVAVSVGKSDSTILYTVEDDGPGVGLGEADEIFEPGARGRAADGVAGS